MNPHVPKSLLDEMLEVSDGHGYETLGDRLVDADDNLLEALVSLRRQKRLTQAVVAEKMGRSITAVSNFERLGNDPHLSTIRRYAAAVGALVTHTVEDYDLWRLTDRPQLVITYRNNTDAAASTPSKPDTKQWFHAQTKSSGDARRN